MSDSTTDIDNLVKTETCSADVVQTSNNSKLKSLRTAAGLTQAGLAVLAGMRQPNISAIERGRRSYVGETVKAKLAKALNCNVNDLEFLS